MATYYAPTVGVPTWSTAAWAVLSNQATGALGPPTAADAVILDSFAGSVSVSATSVAGSIDMTSFANTLVMGNNVLSVSGNLTFGSNSTITTLTTDSTININVTGATITSNGVVFPGSLILGASGNITLIGNLSVLGVLTNANNGSMYSPTIVGSYNISCSTLVLSPNQASSMTLTIPTSSTLTVGNAIHITRIVQFFLNTNNESITVKSSVANTSFNLNYLGPLSSVDIVGATFTDVNASGSLNPLYNYNGATLTRTTNITNVNATNFGGSSTGWW